jgi:hypothetical protein
MLRLNADTVEVTVHGEDGYKGTKTASFNIVGGEREEVWGRVKKLSPAVFTPSTSICRRGE